jgi:hypothetical protein
MNKKILSILFLLVFFCAVAHVSAAEISDDAVASDNSDNITLEANAGKDVKLGEGASDILANGTGDTSTDNSTNTTPVPVVEKSTAVIKASKVKVAYKKSTKWKIKLVDSKKNPIAKTKILLKIYTGKKFKKVSLWTNAKGIATYNTKSLKAGTHKVVASLADDTYNFKAVSTSIKVVKQTPLKIFAKKTTMKEGALLTILVMNKKNKKLVNGVKLKLLIYTGKKYKTVTLKTKTFNKLKGMAGYATNQLSVGTHKVKIIPTDFKYSGSKKTSMTIKKSAKKTGAMSIKL